VAIGETLVHT